MKEIFKVILKSLNIISQRSHIGVGGHNWEKYFIGLFHVSEHVDHFKAIKQKMGISLPPTPCLLKYQTIPHFHFLKSSLILSF